jgi:hypothetical protein
MLLRTSDEQPYRKLRELLPAMGWMSKQTSLADLFPDDVAQEFGVIVTDKARVFTFVHYYSSQGDLKAQAANAVIGDWNEITDRWQVSPYEPNVSDAFRMLGQT